MQNFPYIGPITSYHLAKNIGLPVNKPDRHLERMAKSSGFQSSFDFCKEISKNTGDPIQVVDIVLWRYATLFPSYLSIFKKN